MRLKELKDYWKNILFITLGFIIFAVSIYHWGIKYYDFGSLCLGILAGLIISGFSYLHYEIKKGNKEAFEEINKKYEQINTELLSVLKWKEDGH